MHPPMSSSKLIGGRSLPAAPRCEAAPWLVSKPRSHPLQFSSGSFTVHASSRLPSTEARRLEFLSRTQLRLCWIEQTGRTIQSCLATVGTEFVGKNTNRQNMERLARIRKQLLTPELLPSSYNTAWVAMVPLPGTSHIPCFPQCVEWILQNQQINGSWGHNQTDSAVNKVILLSTLACVLALKRWNVGGEHIKRGLLFIGRYFSIVMDEQTIAPIGFTVIFPRMLSLATEMGLEFPVRQTHLHGILHLREMELKRLDGDKSYGKEAYMAYISEGLGNLLDWNKEVMKFQRKNGSLFNSPSATAAVIIYNYDDKALQYLNLLVSKCGGSVPTVYPTNVYCQLSMVDSLEKIGISHHFSSEIKTILNVTYSFWVERDEEIMLDVATCAMAFRLLRMNGYDVSSDELCHVEEASTFQNSLQGYLNDTKSILELYKASQVNVLENEFILDKIGYWSGNLLKAKLSDGGQNKPIFREVEYAIKFPFYATLDRLDHKRNMENFDARHSCMLKTEHLSCCVNQDFLGLAIEEFKFSQSIYQEELLHLESWAKNNKLDQLQFVRQKVAYCYVAVAATIFHPGLSDARISLAKNSILGTVVDDFFDVVGSKEELENLVALIDKWDEHSTDEFYSEQVKILFYAIYTTVNQLGVVASVVQHHDVQKHMIELWRQVLMSMMTEAETRMRKYVPTMEEYLENGIVSFTLGPVVLISLYFLRQKLHVYVVKDQEYNQLYRLTSICGRLLNDIQGFERESSEEKLDSVSLLVIHSDGSMSTEASKESIRRTIASCRKDLLRLVLKEHSVIPKACRELFWSMSKICHFYYSHTDAFTSPSELVSTVNAVIYEPLKLQSSNPSLHVQSYK